MKVFLAEHMGFCGGVDRAIRMTEAALEGAVVWSVGPIIHNGNVMDGLRARGLCVAESLDDVPDGATVVVRSHGEGPEFFEAAEARGLNVVDATCPKVAKIHELVRDAEARGEHVVIVGDEGHPEVRATRAWGGGGRASVVGGADEFATEGMTRFEGRGPMFVVSQTTYDKEEFGKAAERFRELGANVNDTICEATALRQDACRIVAAKTDCVIVVGDRNSSNTRKLYEIAKNYAKKHAILIENKDEILLKHLCGYDKLGITAGASTPNYVIEEVISSMSEFRSDNYETNPMHEFMDEIDKSTRLPRNGDIVTGEVIQVTDSEVTVNLGCKKDGVIPKSEVSLEEGQGLSDLFKEGDEIQTKVIKNDDGEGNILLSKKRVVVSEHWETITQAYDEKTPIEVKVTREVTGGVIAMFSEVGGFIPLSQLSDRYIEKAEEFVGQELAVKVIRLDQKRNKVVFSHKAVLNEERQKRMQEIWDQLSVGDIIDGKVMRFTDYGAFIDIGGVDGLLHISEISWGKLRHPSDLLEIDQEVRVKILSMNKEKEKISLGYKQNQPEPWSIIDEKYQVGQVIKGKAVQIKDYGVFVEIEPGLDGLVHISEIAFRRVTDISEELEVGQEVSAKILEIDSIRKRISLSIKETLEKPPEDEYEDEEEAAFVEDEAVEEEASVEEASVEDEAPVEEEAVEEEEAVAEEEPAAVEVEEEAVEEEEAVAEEEPAAVEVEEEAVEEEEAVAEEEPAAVEVEEEAVAEEEPAAVEVEEEAVAEEEPAAVEVEEEASVEEEVPAEEASEGE
ncbi:MAG: bifunctional 4-hydroxy-3-methylbut-2-enyl diphosphate reductase/30S ribosomal protein S1 [Clostridiales bacterium]|nr:bifunctional 4-hydroxy-3-methylbut-2-enyl diphosphate reductase/30S ribosomal protein S1 [Clostridiales bacterium]